MLPFLSKTRPTLSEFSYARAITLLAVTTFLSASCGMPAQGGTTGQSTSDQIFRAERDPLPKPITISATLPPATTGVPYKGVLSPHGGVPPYQLRIISGVLPQGLTLDSSTGTISGTPITSGNYEFTVHAGDSSRIDHGNSHLSLKVGTSSNGRSNVTIAISPTSATVTSGATQQFTATVSHTNNTGVAWSSTAGTISGSGLFTAPAVSSSTSVVVTAISSAKPSAKANASVVVTATSPVPPPSPTPLPPPPRPAPTGADNRYCDPGDIPSFGPGDGPAAMPVACFHTALAATPSPGAVIPVPAGSSLSTAINNANCGDTLVLQAGQTYSGFSLPAKNCDAGHYITLVSSAANAGLPPEGTRATPCYAGVSALPGRPNLNCTSTAKVMAKIAGLAARSNIISNADGANYYRFVGLEIADTGANGALGGYYDLVILKNADHIIFDRCYIHGTPVGEDIKGVDFENSSYIAVIDSYVSDIHSKLSGYGADSSAIGSIKGTGPVKIINNFLEASGATILWGGGSSAANITDVELRRNHVFKPLTWWKNSSSYIGVAFAVKNLFENKSGVRELVEGNIFENNWAQAQKGTAILFYPKNQWGTCPGCTVHDVVFRYNVVRHTVNAIGISATYATTCPGQAGGGTGSCRYLSGPLYNLSIHDNVLDDISETTYSPGTCCSDGFLFAIGTDQASNWPHDIFISHNTGFPVGSGTADVTIQSTPQFFANFSFTNNLFGAGNFGFHQALPGGGLPGCGATGGSGAVGVLNGCMHSSWTFSNNAIIGGNLPVPPSPYPNLTTCGSMDSCTQFLGSDWSSVGFVNFNNGNGGDYHLLPTSPYKNAGTDGEDLGADIDGLLVATAGVP